jgi:peptidoglycan hydrolase CwlO-like protein
MIKQGADMSFKVDKIMQDIHNLDGWEFLALMEELIASPYNNLADEDSLLEAQDKLEKANKLLDEKQEEIDKLQDKIEEYQKGEEYYEGEIRKLEEKINENKSKY